MSVLNRILAALTALALLAAAVIGIVEIALAALDLPPWIVPVDDWATWLRERVWTDIVVRVVLAGILILGLLLLVVGLRRGRPSTLPLSSASPGVTFTASRRSVESVLAATARRTDGVTTADASAKRRDVRIDATTQMRDPGDLQSRVASAVEDRLADIGLSDQLRPTVRVRGKEA